MARVGKNSRLRESTHLKPLPQEYLHNIAHCHKKEKPKNHWLQRIGIESLRENKAKRLNINILPFINESTIHFVAIKALFPRNLLGKVVEIQSMPDRSLEEKCAKESAFRKVLLTQFDMKQVMPDHNSATRAVICGLNPELDVRSEEITAIILRGDIVDYAMNHPACIAGGKDPDALKGYCFEMVKCNLPIGFPEIRIMSEILENPIHIFRYDEAHVDKNNKLAAAKKSIYGDRYRGKKPIYIYYDPLRRQYMPLYLKHPKKFGILNESQWLSMCLGSAFWIL